MSTYYVYYELFSDDNAIRYTYGDYGYFSTAVSKMRECFGRDLNVSKAYVCEFKVPGVMAKIEVEFPIDEEAA